ncbi:MAG: EAL domain-containing protein [Candidatus Omnitrophica bacterium]|jgi:EAL domain-containing protein (putative c-di-GMP-specific phosphodiesterase class I)/GGDEF domain-containing protein|nr:EAL domain-containing protein [Candidatus Omnitrophota bacterium]
MMQRHTPKILLCGSGGYADISKLLRDRFGYTHSHVSDSGKLLDRVYDEMPGLIIGLVESPQDPMISVLRLIKRDAVLEFIPILLVVSGGESPEMYSFNEAGIIDRRQTDTLGMAITITLLEVEHQLDVNPFTGLAGHHTSLEKIQVAVDMKGQHALCNIRVRGMELFASHRGATSADILFTKIIDEIRRCFESIVGGSGFLGHLGKRTFVTALSSAHAAAFVDVVIRYFDANYEMMAAFATQDKFASSKDPLIGERGKDDRVTISIAVLPLADHPYRSVNAMLDAANAIHAALSDHPGNVKGGPEVIDGSVPQDAPGSSSEAAGAGAQMVSRFLEEGRIETYFQPIVDYWEGDIIAYEALSRFKEADGSFAHPLVLFDAAREADMVTEMDLACLRTALQSAKGLKRGAKLFLNLNRETFIRLDEHLDLFDLPPEEVSRIVIELTEQSLVGERAKVLKIKSLLQSKGISIAFDDAGTGEVSFREVGEIRPAYIKFDRQLVSGITRSALKQRHVLSMRAFAKGIGARTIAEGIEMPSEFNYFRNIRLDLAQGYLVGKPKKDPDQKIELPSNLGK